MNPKKSSDIIKPTAQSTGVSEQLVSDLTSFYWKDVRKALVNLKFPNISIDSLGTFKAKHWKIPEVEEKYNMYINKLKEHQDKDQMTFQRFSVLKDIELRLSKVTELKIMIEEELVKKKQVKEKRYGNLDTPKTDL